MDFREGVRFLYAVYKKMIKKFLNMVRGQVSSMFWRPALYYIFPFKLELHHDKKEF